MTALDLEQALKHVDHEELTHALHLTSAGMRALLDGAMTMDASRLLVLACYATVPASALIDLALR